MGVDAEAAIIDARSKALSVARRRLSGYPGGYERAEDVAQEVAIAVAGALDRWVDTGAPFGAYVWRVIDNRIHQAQRDYGSDRSVLVEPPERAEAEPDRAVEDLIEQLGEVLAGLPEAAAELVRMRAEGYTVAEVAEATGRTSGAVKVAHHRAMRKFWEVRDALEAERAGRAAHAGLRRHRLHDGHAR